MSEAESRSGKVFKVGAIIFLVLLALLSFSHALRIGQGTGHSIGVFLGGMLIPFLVLGLFMLFKRFRHPKARWQILFCVSMVMCVGKLNTLLLAAS